MKSKTGTREWAEHNRNIQLGCENDCRYCYAREMAVRFKRKRVDTWKNEEILKDKLLEKPKKLSGRIMFPTTHDITQANVELVIDYLRGWLRAGNEILIVSKPDTYCVQRMCESLSPWKSQITFRFTIGSTQNDTLGFWEPHAPSYEQRVNSLCHAFELGYKTSVSCEPFLDTISDVVKLVAELEPYVTDVIWIGKMNQVKKRVNIKNFLSMEMQYLVTMELSQTNASIKVLYEHLKDNPKVKWKDSIKQVIGLAEEEIG